MVAETTISQLRAREALYQKRGASRSKLLEYQDLPHPTLGQDLTPSAATGRSDGTHEYLVE
jgi:hypothetical protein